MVVRRLYIFENKCDNDKKEQLLYSLYRRLESNVEIDKLQLRLNVYF